MCQSAATPTRILTLLLTLFARLSILRLLTSLLQTTRVAQRHKVQRMHLQDAKYLGLMHLRIKRFEQVFVLSDFTFHKIIILELPSKRLLQKICKFSIVEFQARRLTKKTSLVPYSLVPVQPIYSHLSNKREVTLTDF